MQVLFVCIKIITIFVQDITINKIRQWKISAIK